MALLTGSFLCQALASILTERRAKFEFTLQACCCRTGHGARGSTDTVPGQVREPVSMTAITAIIIMGCWRCCCCSCCFHCTAHSGGGNYGHREGSSRLSLFGLLLCCPLLLNTWPLSSSSSGIIYTTCKMMLMMLRRPDRSLLLTFP